jgi:hypothetical protein
MLLVRCMLQCSVVTHSPLSYCSVVSGSVVAECAEEPACPCSCLECNRAYINIYTNMASVSITVIMLLHNAVHCATASVLHKLHMITHSTIMHATM